MKKFNVYYQIENAFSEKIDAAPDYFEAENEKEAIENAKQ